MTPEHKTSIDSVSAYSKTVIDLMKHLTSLCVGTIVIVATFHEKLNKDAHWVWALPVAIILMLWCVALALKICYTMMFNEGRLASMLVGVLTKTTTEKKMEDFKIFHSTAPKRDRALNTTLLLTNWTFGISVSLIALFVVRNFFA